MKKRFLLIMLFFVATLAHGQKAKFGLKVGAAFSKSVGADTKSDTATSSYFGSLDYKPTISGGFYINSKVGEYFWIKHEVNYVNRG